MTEAEANKLLIKALEEAAYIKYGELFNDSAPVPEAGSRFRREMRRMLRNPLGYAADYERPQWLRVARTAAAVFLCLMMLFGSAMMIPPVRAAVQRVLNEWYEEYVRIWYNEADSNFDEESFVKWRLADIPEGYEENVVINLPYTEKTLFVHTSKPQIDFYYSAILSDGGVSIDIEHYELTEITLDGGLAYRFDPIADQYRSHLVWFDRNHEYIFHLSSELSCDALIKLAESTKKFSQ